MSALDSAMGRGWFCRARKGSSKEKATLPTVRRAGGFHRAGRKNCANTDARLLSPFLAQPSGYRFWPFEVRLFGPFGTSWPKTQTLAMIVVLPYRATLPFAQFYWDNPFQDCSPIANHVVVLPGHPGSSNITFRPRPKSLSRSNPQPATEEETIFKYPRWLSQVVSMMGTHTVCSASAYQGNIQYFADICSPATNVAYENGWMGDSDCTEIQRSTSLMHWADYTTIGSVYYVYMSRYTCTWTTWDGNGLSSDFESGECLPISALPHNYVIP